MADTTIDSGVSSSLYLITQRGGPFYRGNTGYVFYPDDGQDLAYRKTVDGSTWNETIIQAGSFVSIDCWAGWETPGNETDTKIYIVAIDANDNKVKYYYLDTADDSTGTDDIYAGTSFSSTPARTTSYCTITLSAGGNFCVAFKVIDNAVNVYKFYTSPDADTWTDETGGGQTPWESDMNDLLLLFPANLADTNDIWGLFYDNSTVDYDLKTYDDSGNTWSTQNIFTADGGSIGYVNFCGAIRQSDGNLLTAIFNIFDNAGADLITYDIANAGSITSKGTILTDSAETVLPSMLIDQSNNYVYVAYIKGGTWSSTTTVYYQYSDDGMATWEGETGYQEDAADDERWVGCGSCRPSDGGWFRPVFFNDDLNDLFCNLTNDVAISAVAGEGWTNIAKINGVTATDLAKVDGISVNDIAKICGVAV